MIEQISNATPNKILNLGLFGGKIVTFHRFSTPPYLSICPIQNVNSWFSYSDRLFMVSDGMYVYVCCPIQRVSSRDNRYKYIFIFFHKMNSKITFTSLRGFVFFFRPSDLVTTLAYVLMDNFCPCS